MQGNHWNATGKNSHSNRLYGNHYIVSHSEGAYLANQIPESSELVTMEIKLLQLFEANPILFSVS